MNRIEFQSGTLAGGVSARTTAAGDRCRLVTRFVCDRLIYSPDTTVATLARVAKSSIVGSVMEHKLPDDVVWPPFLSQSRAGWRLSGAPPG